MPTWLENNGGLLLALLVLGTGFALVVWWQRRQRYALYTALGLAGLAAMGALYLYVLASESDRQQLERKIRELAASVKDRKLAQAFEHVSQDFSYKGRDKATFLKAAEAAVRDFDLEEIVVWDFEPVEINRDKRRAVLSFMVKARGSFRGRETPYRCEATFVLEPANQWRVTHFALFNPFVDTRQPIDIPGI